MTKFSINTSLPKHLSPLIIDQNYNRYTAQDQAGWRLVMKQNTKYLKNIAHSSYVAGLQKIRYFT